MTDRDFIDDMDRAARSLRAAVTGAVMMGVNESDVRRIVEDGLAEAYSFAVTGRSLARAARLGHRPTGEPKQEIDDELPDSAYDDGPFADLFREFPEMRDEAARYRAA